MKQSVKYSPEVRERAVRLGFECRSAPPAPWAAVESIAAKMGGSVQTRQGWVRRHETDTGPCNMTTAESQRFKALEREVRALRKVHAILRLASAFFAQAERDRRFTS